MFDLVTRFGRKALVLAGAVVAVAAASAPASASENAMSYKVFNAGAAPRSLQNSKFDATKVSCGVQFSGTIPAATTFLYFTFDWSPSQHIAWDVMPTTTYSGGSEFSLTNVAVQLSSSTDTTYWLTISNNSSSSQNFEGRFCIL